MTPEERREKKNQRQKAYYQRNKKAILEKQAKYQKDNTELHNARTRKYYNSKPGRANNLLNAYRRKDKDHGRGECTLTRDWIVDKIFNASCIYCGETDWRKLGCDRVDNTKAHTPDNCVCSCQTCNMDRQFKRMSVEEFKRLKGGPGLDHPTANNM